jgi:hypothetical protein
LSQGTLLYIRIRFGLGLWCLTSLSRIFQLYRGGYIRISLRRFINSVLKAQTIKKKNQTIYIVYIAIVNFLIYYSRHVNISYLYTGIHVHVIKHTCQQSTTYPLDLQIRKHNFLRIRKEIYNVLPLKVYIRLSNRKPCIILSCINWKTNTKRSITLTYKDTLHF